MDSINNQKPLTSDQLMLLDSCITQSRTSLFYTQEDQNQDNLNQENSIIGQTRKFKLEIEDKFHHSQHNRKYLFPRDICFGQEEYDKEEENMVKSLMNVRLYRLTQQNIHREEAFQMLKKSRSESTVGLFKQALQIEKGEPRHVSKSKTKELPTSTATKPLSKFKKVVKDKENNLNFQNLREEKQSVSRASMSKTKGKIPSSNITIAKPKKINIPRINLSDRDQQQPAKCFRDLARLQNYRR